MKKAHKRALTSKTKHGSALGSAQSPAREILSDSHPQPLLHNGIAASYSWSEESSYFENV